MRDYSMFVVPYSATDEGADGGITDMAGLDALLDTMGGEDSSNGTPPEGEPPKEDASQNNESTGDTGTDNKDSAGKHTPEEQRNYAFGQMRTQISQLTDLLGKVAKANGIEYADSKDLMAKLTDDAITKMAQKQNVPVELLKELEMLKQDSRAFKEQQLKNAAAIGFQKVMDDYGLSQEELKQFAVDLDRVGKNPFTQPIDIVNEYKMMHYDDILKKEVQKAVEEALKKDSAANESSSTPNGNQGGGEGGTAKITTVAGLNALLDGMKA